MSRLPLFDSNCFFGKSGNPQPGMPTNADELLSVMDEMGIEEALVFHYLSHISTNTTADYDFLLSESAKSVRLHSCLPVMLEQAGFSSELAREMVADFLNRGVKAIRIYPRRMGPLKDYMWSDLFGALAERKVVTFIDFDLAHWGAQLEKIDWGGLEWILTAFPALPVVLLRAGYSMDRVLLPLMKKCKNLHIETSYYVGTNKLERLCETLGPQRALFGTGMSLYDPSVAVTLITYSGLNDEAKRMVAGENLRCLLSKVNT